MPRRTSDVPSPPTGPGSPPEPPRPPGDSPPPLPPSPGRSRWRWWLIGAVTVVAGAVVAMVLLLTGDGDPAAEDEITPSTTTSTGPGSTSLPLTTTSTSTTTTTVPGQVDPVTGPATIDGLSAEISPELVLSASWQDPGDEVGYTYVLTPGSPGSLPADVTTFTLNLMPCGTPITITLTAVGSDGGPLAVGEAVAAAAACPPEVSPPTDLRVEAGPDPNTVTIRWNDAEGEAAYRLHLDITDRYEGPQQPIERDLPANEESEEVGVYPCGRHLAVTLTALAADGHEIGRAATDYQTRACAAWELMGVEVVWSPWVEAGSGITTATAQCPPMGSVLGGGYDAGPLLGDFLDERGWVVRNAPAVNAWQASLVARPDTGASIRAFAICGLTRNLPTTVEAALTVPSGSAVQANAVCPDGTYVVGGGWWADPGLNIMNSFPVANSWVVAADDKIDVGIDRNLRAYAVCLDDSRLTHTIVSTLAAGPPGEMSRARSPVCPEGGMITGGGFAVPDNVVEISNLVPGELEDPSDDRWQVDTINLAPYDPDGPPVAWAVDAVCVVPQ